MAVLKPKSDAERRRELEAQRNLGSMAATREAVREMAPVIGRSSVLGFFVGVLPGAGATIASFLAYGTEQLAERRSGALAHAQQQRNERTEPESRRENMDGQKRTE